MKGRILSIEDDFTMQALIEGVLRDFEVVKANSLKEARLLLNQSQYDAAILDINLPDGDGLRLLTELYQNEQSKDLPVMILSGQDDISNKVMAFSFGAEDFITKPFDPAEFYARVSSKVAKRKSYKIEKSLLRAGDLILDLEKRKAFHFEEGKKSEILLTAIEFKIALMMARDSERVFSRNQILEEVWGDTNVLDRTVDSHMANLRKKLAPASFTLEAVKSVGYRAIF